MSFIFLFIMCACFKLCQAFGQYSPLSLSSDDCKAGEEAGENSPVNDTNIFTSVLYKKCKRRVFKR